MNSLIQTAKEAEAAGNTKQGGCAGDEDTAVDPNPGVAVQELKRSTTPVGVRNASSQRRRPG